MNKSSSSGDTKSGTLAARVALEAAINGALPFGFVLRKLGASLNSRGVLANGVEETRRGVMGYWRRNSAALKMILVI